MIYLWGIPEKFLNRDVGEYDRDVSPNRFLLSAGRPLESHEFSPAPVVNFEVPKKRLLKFDCLPNKTQVPLINNRLKNILEKLAPDDVQFFSAKLICSDGDLDDYYFLNIKNLIKGIDHEKSIYTKIKMADAISMIHYLTYKEGCMGAHQLARDEEYKGNIS